MFFLVSSSSKSIDANVIPSSSDKRDENGDLTICINYTIYGIIERKAE